MHREGERRRQSRKEPDFRRYRQLLPQDGPFEGDRRLLRRLAEMNDGPQVRSAVLRVDFLLFLPFPLLFPLLLLYLTICTALKSSTLLGHELGRLQQADGLVSDPVRLFSLFLPFLRLSPSPFRLLVSPSRPFPSATLHEPP
jgi:hypothetical protein